MVEFLSKGNFDLVHIYVLAVAQFLSKVKSGLAYLS